MRLPLIDDNPLRILGVFANASLREAEQNRAQLRAFARVGQEAQLPLWLNGLSLLKPLPPVTEEMLALAQAQLTLQTDRDRYSLFWFERDKEHVQDEQRAIELLNANQVGEASQIWQQRTDHAAQKNLLLLAVMADDWNEIGVRAAKCFGNDMPVFRLFMGEVVKWSAKANEQLSNDLPDHFAEDIFKEELKRLLVNHHKCVLDEAIDQLERTKNSEAPLLRKEIDKALAELKRVDALQNLLGSGSFTCSFYIDKVALALMTALCEYTKLDVRKRERRWALKIANHLCGDFSANAANRDSLLTMRAAIKSRKRNRTYGKIVDYAFDDSSSCGCNSVVWIPLFYLFMFIIIKCCDGDKKKKPKNDPFQYNYERYFVPLPDYDKPSTLEFDDARLMQVQEELQKKGIDMSKDSLKQKLNIVNSILKKNERNN